MKRLITLFIASVTLLGANAQTTADDVLSTTRKVNDYFMAKYADPTIPTNVKRIRPSSLWTRAVYYEGLMALQQTDPQQRYVDYAMKWADFHQWTPRNGIATCDADDQCCEQTYIELIPYATKSKDELLKPTIQNLAHQMKTPNDKKADGALYGWWTWIDAIQMAMPVYTKMWRATGEQKYLDHAMKMYQGRPLVA